MTTFRFRMLPAADGDCMLLSWGEGGPLHHMVVDGGRASAYPFLHAELMAIADAGETLDLYVLTHIDADHIEGALSYLKDGNRPIAPKDVWYNGYRQMRKTGRRSMKQGDDYSAALAKLGWPLNRHFSGGVASIDTAPVHLQVAGLKVTMLSPDTIHLKALGDKWETWRAQQAALNEAKDREGMRGSKQDRNPIPDPLVLDSLVADGETDTELPNGSSIAFVAEWEGRRILMGGDAHPDALVSSLGPLAEGGRYRVDVLKASHHGSAKNTSRRLIELIDCRRIAISTNGNLHGHPDPQSLARFLHFGTPGTKKLYFNFETDRTRPWNDTEAKRRYGYTAYYPTNTPGVLEIDLMKDE